jgi:hypothetical protein
MRVTASVSKAKESAPKPAPKSEPKDSTTVVPSEPVDAKNVVVHTDEIATDQDTTVDLSSSDLDTIAPEHTEKVPTKISSVLESAHAFIRNVAPDIVDNLVVGETPIIPLAIELIEWAESNVLAGKLTGQQKKRIVIKVLIWLIDNQEDIIGRDLGFEKEQMKDIVQNVLPSMIDAIIGATKGKILVNKFAKSAKSCISICCP